MGVRAENPLASRATHSTITTLLVVSDVSALPYVPREELDVICSALLANYRPPARGRD